MTAWLGSYLRLTIILDRIDPGRFRFVGFYRKTLLFFKADLEQCERIDFEAGDSRWVVVCQDHRGGVIGQAALHHFPRIDRGAVDGALEQFVEPQDVMLVGQEDATEDLALAIAEAGAQVFPGGLGTAQYVAVLYFGVQLAVAEFAHRRQARGLGRTDTRHAGDLPEVGRQQAREPVESLQQVASRLALSELFLAFPNESDLSMRDLAENLLLINVLQRAVCRSDRAGQSTDAG